MPQTCLTSRPSATKGNPVLHFRKPLEDIDRPQMEADVVIIGGGPAGMACALRLSQLIDQHNLHDPDSPLSKDNIYVLEKARDAGQHCLSGALLDPRSMQELLPGFEAEAPIDAEVTQESVYFLTKEGQYKFPIVPPPLRDHGNYVISINKFVKWLAAKVEEAGITIFTGFAGSELLFKEDDGEENGFDHGVVGVRTDDKGVDKQGEPKANFEPGYDLHAKITILAEGTRGNCAKQLIQSSTSKTPTTPRPMASASRSCGRFPPAASPGRSIYTLGYPLTPHEYGGAWIYGISRHRDFHRLRHWTRLRGPRTDPHHVFPELQTHPLAAASSRAARWSATARRACPTEAGSPCRNLPATAGCCSATAPALLNSQRLKGIHLAIKSGMLAAETAFDALLSRRTIPRTELANYKRRVDESWIREELYPVRNFHQGFEHGLIDGLIKAGIQQLLKGGNLGPDFTNRPGYENMRPIATLGEHAHGREAFLGNAVRATASSPSTGLPTSTTPVPGMRTISPRIWSSPIWTSATPAASGSSATRASTSARPRSMRWLGRWLTAESAETKRLQINFANCVHCKTCDIADPYQIITWVPPEGGGGPNYDGM
jgi:electron-transferring-flavoprotein dehydrogenase